MGNRYAFMSILKCLMKQGFWKSSVNYRGTTMSITVARDKFQKALDYKRYTLTNHFYISIAYIFIPFPLFWPKPVGCISVSNPRRQLTGGIGEYGGLAITGGFWGWALARSLWSE